MSEIPKSREELTKLRNVDLKDILRSLSLKVSGNKKDLVQRILDHMKPIPPIASTSLETMEDPTKLPPVPLRESLPIERKTEIISQTVTLPPLAVQVKEKGKDVLNKDIIEKTEEKVIIELPKSPGVEPSVIITPSVQTLPALGAEKVPIPEGLQTTFPGQGGLPGVEELETLRLAQEGVSKAKLIEPEASFQKGVTAKQPERTLPPVGITPPQPDISSLVIPPVSSIPAELEQVKVPPISPITLPTLKEFKLPPVSEIKEPEIKELVIPKPITTPKEVPLPTKRPKEVTPSIRIPKIKTTAVKPSPKRISKPKAFVPPIGGMQLPEETTVIPSIPITSPSALQTSKIAVAKTESAQVMENIKTIDINKLNVGKTRKGDGSYSVTELRSIAGSINLIKSGNKKQLVERIKATIKKVNPSAFD